MVSQLVSQSVVWPVGHPVTDQEKKEEWKTNNLIYQEIRKQENRQYQSGSIERAGDKCLTYFISVVRFGSTPLHQAAYFGHCDCAAVLLAGGALVNVEEAWGQTPLFLAAQRAHRLVL